ncbi:(S)-benzoin forming benzil reductase [Alkaliphilus transvaalensis]|uniref:(S)-benzoin forming benzil reductase n=1 Tax=Alkaliphilus transvaalensis TaxID=114628 RepID=UPI00047B7B45|nr:(S)-benzoin forming benzil reductase [Alkaliphilus transvaalensis]
MKVFIITGTSRGLGNSLVRKLIDSKHHIFCITRRPKDELTNYAKEKKCRMDYLEFDLSEVSKIAELMNKVFDKINLSEIKAISLINNAGILAPMKRIEDCEGSEIINNINVNLLAPIVLTSEFIKHVKPFEGDKRIINISSGAGKKPYYGWSNYCASKAGLDLFTQCVGVEQSTGEQAVKILSLAPAIMDTEMQAEIRRTDIKDFEQVERFKDFKNNGLLLSVDEVAEKVIKVLVHEDYQQGGVIDVRDIC